MYYYQSLTIKHTYILVILMLHIMQNNTIWTVRFPTETMKNKFKKRLSMLKLKVDINKPLYEILFDAITEKLQIQADTNSIGLTHEQMTKVIDKVLYQDKDMKVTEEKE